MLRRAQWTLNKLWCHVKGDSAVEEGDICVAMLYGHIFLVYLRMRGCLAVQLYACAGKCI